MLLWSWLIQLYHVVQKFLGLLKNVHLESALESSRQHVMYETEHSQTNLQIKGREDLWLQLPPAAGHDWWIWAVLGYLYGSETWKAQGILYSEPAHSLSTSGGWAESWGSSSPLNKWMAKLAFWVPGLLERVCVEWGKYKSKCKTWKLSQWKLLRKFGENQIIWKK